MTPSSPSESATSTPILVLGSGAWGTALAMVLGAAGRSVRVWGHDGDYAEEIQRTRKNRKFLPDVDIPSGLRFGGDIESLADGVETVLSVIPTQFLRESMTPLLDHLPGEGLFVSCSKGFEAGSHKRPAELLAEWFPKAQTVVLSGPSHAEEVSRGLPSALVAASDDERSARRVQELLSGSRFRVYTSVDPIGVEVGGATKNVIAIACGISDGLGFGDNSRAALMTRGLHEMTRLGVALGGQPVTFAGLSGMGDLVVTCSSQLSRNWTVGHRIGRGETLDEILASTEKVAEGVNTTLSLSELAEERGIDLPITREVFAVLFRKKPARKVVESLMAREFKQEKH